MDVVLANKYKINMLNCAGHGTTGSVFQGVITETNEPIAAKQISASSHKSLENEDKCNSLRQLVHTNILNILDVLHEHSSVWIVMPLCIPGNLDNYFKETSPDSDTITNIISQLISALKYLHTLNTPIIHRNIKPTNILVSNKDGYPLVKLTGLEHAIFAPELNIAQTFIYRTAHGTPGYMGPEFFQTRHEYGRSSDIFSLGLVILAMALWQRSPQGLLSPGNMSIGQTMALAKSMNIPATDYAGQISDDSKLAALKPLVQKMIEFEPEDRINIQEASNLFHEVSGLGVECSGAETMEVVPSLKLGSIYNSEAITRSGRVEMTASAGVNPPRSSEKAAPPEGPDETECPATALANISLDGATASRARGLELSAKESGKSTVESPPTVIGPDETECPATALANISLDGATASCARGMEISAKGISSKRSESGKTTVESPPTVIDDMSVGPASASYCKGPDETECPAIALANISLDGATASRSRGLEISAKESGQTTVESPPTVIDDMSIGPASASYCKDTTPRAKDRSITTWTEAMSSWSTTTGTDSSLGASLTSSAAPDMPAAIDPGSVYEGDQEIAPINDATQQPSHFTEYGSIKDGTRKKMHYTADDDIIPGNQQLTHEPMSFDTRVDEQPPMGETATIRKLRVGDHVLVNDSPHNAAILQVGHGPWNDYVKQYLGKIGVVTGSRNNVKVKFEDGNTILFHRQLLHPIGTSLSDEEVHNFLQQEEAIEILKKRFKRFTVVKIKTTDPTEFKRLQNYSDTKFDLEMLMIMDNYGMVRKIDSPTEIYVEFPSDRNWRLHPDVLAVVDMSQEKFENEDLVVIVADRRLIRKLQPHLLDEQLECLGRSGIVEKVEPNAVTVKMRRGKYKWHPMALTIWLKGEHRMKLHIGKS